MNSSCLGSLSSACARRVARSAATASARVCPGSSSLAVSVAVAHTNVSILHLACYNSWSDTGSARDPRGGRGSKREVSRLAEDLRRVSEVEAGVIFRPTCGVLGQVAGLLPRRQPGTGIRRRREGAVTPSFHPKVPDTRLASLGSGWASGNR